MTLWIIIGALVAIVAIFLVVMSIKDRKKMKMENLKVSEIEKIRSESRENVILFLNELFAENDTLLKKFVPSVGSLKMGDIRAKAKKALVLFKKKEEFKYAADSDGNKKLIEVYNKFEKQNSNVWQKRLEQEMKDIKKAYKNLDKDFIKEYEPVAKKVIAEAYK